RGIVLQTAVEAVLAKHPQAEVCFASPLASNPEFLLDLFQRRINRSFFLGSLSPVSQNLILIDEVYREIAQAKFSLIAGETPIDLGIRELGFEFRGSKYQQRAKLAKAITKDDESTLLFA